MSSSGPIVLQIPQFFKVADDEIVEQEQSFALVAEVDADVPESFVCFKPQFNDRNCYGRRGATEIRIVDDDGMLVLISAYTQHIVDHVYNGNQDR